MYIHIFICIKYKVVICHDNCLGKKPQRMMGREIEPFSKLCKNVTDKMESLICKEKKEPIHR